MGNEKIKINIDAHGSNDPDNESKLLLGGHFITLEDQTRRIVHVRDLESFGRYIAWYTAENPGGYAIFADTNRVTCMPDVTDYTVLPVAMCEFEVSDRASAIMGSLNRDLGPGEAERLLRPNRRFLDNAGRDILNRVTNLRISSLQNIIREKGRDGTFEVSIQRKTGGSDVIDIPENFTITFPLYDYHDVEISLAAETFFDYEVLDGSVKIVWRFDCYELEEAKLTAYDEMIHNHLDGLELPIYFGNCRIKNATNEWMYKKNHLEHF